MVMKIVNFAPESSYVALGFLNKISQKIDGEPLGEQGRLGAAQRGLGKQSQGTAVVAIQR